MKTLVLGAEGMLGRQVVKEFGLGNHSVVAADRAEADIGNLSEVRNLFSSTTPEVVIHCAAYTDVDGAERSPERAYRVNAMGTRNVAQCCEEMRARLVCISSDYVFDGAACVPYREFDRPNPLSVYGHSKYQAEWYASRLCRRFVIVRTSWLYGPGGRNFVSAILEKARRGEELKVVDDQLGAPTFTGHLAQALRNIVEADALGIFHVTGQGRCTWFEFAKYILEKRDLDVPVTPVLTPELGQLAPRPSFSLLDNFNMQLEGLPLLPHWRDGLAAHFGD